MISRSHFTCLVLLAALMTGCSDSGPTESTDERIATSVELAPDSMSMPPGDTIRLSVTVRDQEGIQMTGKSISWSSGNETVATVRPDGLVTAVARGKTSIVAEQGELTATATVVVTDAPDTVFVHRTEGVVGNLPDGPSAHARGAVIEYQFSAAEGYDNLRVVLDGATAPAEGTFTVAGNHHFVVVATTQSVPRQEVVDLAADLRTLLHAPDPIAAEAEFLRQASELYEAIGPAEASARLRAAAVMAFDSADPRLMDEFHRRLSGAATSLPPDPMTSGGVALDLLPVDEVGTKPTTLYYVNGILNVPSDNLQAYLDLKWIAAEAGFRFHSGSSLIKRYYNHSPLKETFACMLSQVLFGGKQFVVTPEELNACLDAHWSRELVLQTAREYLNSIAGFPAPVAQQTSELTELLKAEIRAGRKLIVTAFSEGNLLTQGAISGFSDRALACVGAVSLAPPNNSAWRNDAAASLYIEGKEAGDILLLLNPGAPAGVRQPNDSTEAADKRIAAYNTWADVLFFHDPEHAAVVKTANMLRESVGLHSVIPNYMWGTPTRGWIREQLASQERLLAETCQDSVRIVTTERRVTRAAPLRLQAEVYNPLDELIDEPRIIWRSRNERLAAVDSTGLVTVVGERGLGKAWIVAQRGTISDSIQVDVINIPMEQLGFDGEPHDVSDGGVVVGGYSPGIEGDDWNEYPFSWSRGGGLKILSDRSGDAQAINELHQIVGGLDSGGGCCASAVWNWEPDDEYLSIGSGAATGINESSVVVGSDWYWKGDDQLRLRGDDQYYATDINDSGIIVGSRSDPDGRDEAVLWPSPSAAPVPIVSGSGETEATAINSAGHVVGFFTRPDGVVRAFLWTPAEGARDIGSLGGPTAVASDINDAGEIVGMSETADGRVNAFLWTPELGMLDLGGIGEINAATALNNTGLIVGYGETASGAQRVLLWDRGTIESSP